MTVKLYSVLVLPQKDVKINMVKEIVNKLVQLFTLNVKKDSLIGPVVYVPTNVLKVSETMVYIVLNLKLMEEELDMYYGKEINAKVKILKVVKKMDYYGTLNVNLDSTMQDVVFVLPTVLPDGLISEFLVKNLNLMVEVLVSLYLLV